MENIVNLFTWTDSFNMHYLALASTIITRLRAGATPGINMRRAKPLDFENRVWEKAASYPSNL